MPPVWISARELLRGGRQATAGFERLAVVLVVVVLFGGSLPNHESPARRRRPGSPESPQLLVLPVIVTARNGFDIFERNHAGVEGLDNSDFLIGRAEMICVNGVRSGYPGEGVIFEAQIQARRLEEVEGLRRLTSAAAYAADYKGYH